MHPCHLHPLQCTLGIWTVAADFTPLLETISQVARPGEPSTNSRPAPPLFPPPPAPRLAPPTTLRHRITLTSLSPQSWPGWSSFQTRIHQALFQLKAITHPACSLSRKLFLRFVGLDSWSQLTGHLRRPFQSIQPGSRASFFFLMYFLLSSYPHRYTGSRGVCLFRTWRTPGGQRPCVFDSVLTLHHGRRTWQRECSVTVCRVKR